MNTLIFEGVMTLMTSLSHIGDSFGVNSKLRREKVIQTDGSVEEVPIVSGNAIRGILRDRGMLHMLRVLGYGVDEQTGEVHGLPLPAFYFLFSGGSLSGGGKALDIDEARRWRQLIPLVGLFGGAMGNQIMPGKIKCGKAIPICLETAHLLPERFVPQKPTSVWEYCQEEAYTRRDDEKNDNLRQLLQPETRVLLDAAFAEKKKKSALPATNFETETGQKQQMRYYIETLAAGTRLYWDMAMDDVTDLERETMFVTLAEFSRMPYIGGKSGTGHGKVSVIIDKWLEIDSRIKKGNELDVRIGTLYADHLAKNGNEIKAALDAFK